MKTLNSFPWGVMPGGMSFDPFIPYANAPDQVGQMYVDAEGGKYMLAEYDAGGNAPAIGKMVEHVATTVLITGGVPTFVAVAAGATKLVLTTAALTANAHLGDDLFLTLSTGLSQQFKVQGNSTTEIFIDRPLVTAIAATTLASLVKPISFVQIAIASNTPKFSVGMALATPTATNKYFVVKGRGLANVISDATVVVTGAPVRISAAGGVNGSIIVNGSAAVQQVGIGLAGGTSTRHCPVWLTCL
jgi:hypothetical protein